MQFHFHCLKCEQNFFKESHICDRDLNYEYIEVVYDYSEIKQLPLEKRKGALSKLSPLLKLNNILGEGNTPLLRINNFSATCQDHEVYVKNEGQNPTGSFKDRESAIVLDKAKELGHKKVFIISSGNAALSAAAYTKKAGIKCDCFIPVKTSLSKKQIIRIFDADLHQIDGDYEKVYRQVMANPPANSWNITSGYNFFREEGSKKIAFEIWEQIGVPDVAIIPIGNGCLFSAIFKGFYELKQCGLTNKLPKFVGVQIKNASPITKALQTGKDFVTLKKVPNSVAEGIIARESYCSPKVLRAIKKTKGSVIEVSDKEVISALKKIIERESLCPEPTAAVVYAALGKLSGLGDSKMKIVCLQTGNGLKDIKTIARLTCNK